MESTMPETELLKNEIAEELCTEIEITNKVISNLKTQVDGFGSKVQTLEVELEKTKAQLVLQKDINALVIHDIRGTAISLSMLSKMLSEESELKGRHDDYVLEIHNRSARMLRLIDTNLALLRIEKGEIECKKEPVDIVKVISEVIEQNSQLIVYKKIVINYKKNALFVVCGENSLVYSVFNNIITNAIEASPENSPIEICFEKNGVCSIKVHNFGEVPQEIRDTFFQKYVTAGKYRGTGIGTYSSKVMAIAMGGDILLDTSESGATTVKVIFPLFQGAVSD